MMMSLQKEIKKLDVGVIIRDNSDNIVACCCEYIANGTNNKAKLMVVYIGLLLILLFYVGFILKLIM